MSHIIANIRGPAGPTGPAGPAGPSPVVIEGLDGGYGTTGKTDYTPDLDGAHPFTLTFTAPRSGNILLIYGAQYTCVSGDAAAGWISPTINGLGYSEGPYDSRALQAWLPAKAFYVTMSKTWYVTHLPAGVVMTIGMAYKTLDGQMIGVSARQATALLL